MTCPCGKSLEPVLVRAGSVWCHDCRGDPRRAADALEQPVEVEAEPQYEQPAVA